MAITVRTPVASNNGGGGTSITVTLPTGHVAGDVLVMCVTARGGTGTTITASGWTLLNRSDSGTTLAQATYYRIDDGTLGASVSVTLTSSKASAVCYALQGASNEFAAAQYNGQANASSLTIASAALGSWTSCNGVSLAFGGMAYGGNTVGTPTNYTNGANGSSTGGSASTRTQTHGSHRALSAVTTVGTLSETWTGTAGVNIGSQVFVKEAVLKTSTEAGTGADTSGLTADIHPSSAGSGGAAFADTFNRVVSNDWGTADTGGAYTTIGTASILSVGSAVGVMALPASGSIVAAVLASVAQTEQDILVSVTADKLPNNAAALYIGPIGRYVDSANYYFAAFFIEANGAMRINVKKRVANSESDVGTLYSSGTYTVGDKIWIRLNCTGTNPTTVRAKFWKDGNSEPSWQASATDSTAAMQGAEGVGIRAQWDTITNNPLTLDWDDLQDLAGVAGGFSDVGVGMDTEVSVTSDTTDKSGADSGVGAETSSPPVAALGSTEAGTGVDTAALGAATDARTESGAATETAAVTVPVATSDAGVGAETAALAAALAGTAEAGAGADTATPAAVAGTAEAGVGAETASVDQGTVAKSASDAGVGVETAQVTGAVGAFDSGVFDSGAFWTNATGQTLTIPTASLVLTKYAPALSLGAVVPVKTLTALGYAPGLVVTATVPVVALVVTGYAPALSLGATIPVKALTLTTYGPDVPRWVPTAALTLTTYAPALSGQIVLDIPVKALAVSGYAPALSLQADIPVKALTVSGYAPALQPTLVVPVKSLTATGYAPLLQVTAVVPTVALGLTTYGPSVPRWVPTAALTLTTYAPVLGAALTLTVPTASLVLTGYAPSVAAPAYFVVPTIRLRLETYAPSRHLSYGGFIGVTTDTLMMPLGSPSNVILP